MLAKATFLAILLAGASVEAQTITRYTTSTARGAIATGTCLTPATRCTNTYALSLSSAGDIVRMEGNTMAAPYEYKGAKDMLAAGGDGGGLRANLSGGSGAPITVRCEVDGGCLLNGEFTRIPVDLVDTNNWFVLEDFNVKHGTFSVVRIKGSNNIVRRVVAWDNQFNSTNNGTGSFGCFTPGVNNLFEDVAGFGMGTWIFTHSQNKAGACKFRRAWGRFEGTANGSNGGTAFGGLFYKALSTTCDNCIGEYRPNIGLTAYTVVNPTTTSRSGCPGDACTDGVPPIPNGPINQNRWFDDGDTTCQTNQTLCNMDGYVGGSFFYIQSDTNMSRMTIGHPSGGALMTAGVGRIGGQMTFKDVLWFVPTSHAQFSNVKALNVNERIFSTDMFLTNVTTVSGSANIVDTVDNSGGGTSGVWIKTNMAELAATTTLGAGQASNPWTGTVGANLCYRYVDRVRQDGTGGAPTTPLWPWPMNDRILAATGQAGAYSGPCTGCVGTFPTRTAVNVMTLIEGMLGTIPAACRTDTPPTTFPEATGFAPATLSTF